MGRDPYRYFRVEARELLDELGKCALDLDKGTATPELIALMLRLAHTLKGAARVVRQRMIADEAHAIEDALAPCRDTGGPVSRKVVDAVHEALDKMDLGVASLAPALEGDGAAVRTTPSVETESFDTAVSNVDEMDVLLGGLSEASARLATLRRGIGALVNGAQQSLNHSAQQLDRELSQVREAAERLRLLPARLMFVSLQRAAYDAGRSLGKRLAFETSGGDVRVETQVFSVVQNALVQAVRNAVAHGIESAADREAAGKPAEGRVSVQVRQRGHQVVFVCHDDGRGVDIEAVRQAMQNKGIPAAQAAKLDAAELLQVLLSGGISTSGAVTQLAGRGIGLDVVREAVARLRGEVGIRTDPAGTTLEITVPVHLSAVNALIVEAGGRTAAIPLEAVKRTLRVPAGDVMQSPEGAAIQYEGTVIRFAPLEGAFRRASMRQGGARVWSAVVIEGGNEFAAVGVDHVRGTQNLIVRRLPGLTPSDSVIAGACLDAEGHPQLVFDPQELVKHVRGAESERDAGRLARVPILVIDDSLTTRMLEQSILESAGYDVELATSGEMGLERARQRRYALFLVDVEMPGMDGFTFIAQARMDPALRDIPAILVTSREAPEDRARGRTAGAQAYIVKGEFDQNELLGTIRSLLVSP